MNITALRPRFRRYLEPLAGLFVRLRLSPNQLSALSLFAGLAAMVLFATWHFFFGAVLLFVSSVLDLVDGSVARLTGRHSSFGAVFDWIVDKYVDAAVLLGIGMSGIPIVSDVLPVPPIVDTGLVMLAIIGSLMNTFIKPVVYAEVGYVEREGGKIQDPLEGVGFFGRPETVLCLCIGGAAHLLAGPAAIGAAIVLIAVCTNLSAAQRVIYLYRRLA
ncbi:MAG TPA: CDP-alcohol phosphatidyltransferase family protein [Methanoregulaceae archaeon]|nr:CDP-alcohol phosphatidyltransferase family protein [Methanoregulaceae archaeon]HQJ88297.1 CDP-alcohol phosphatidyltransferase family protein [Methanoregulaceae archaeon]